MFPDFNRIEVGEKFELFGEEYILISKKFVNGNWVVNYH